MTQPDDENEYNDDYPTDDHFIEPVPEPPPTTCGLCHSTIDSDGRRTGDPRGRDRHTCSMCCW